VSAVISLNDVDLPWDAGPAGFRYVREPGARLRWSLVLWAWIAHVLRSSIMNRLAAGPDGRSQFAGGGKSELRRAVCRITSGRPCSSAVDGKCHRKQTTSP